MFKNYLKIALRNLRRNKSYSFINIAGLAMGMACCIVIVVFVQGELIYDNYHEKADQIFRLAIKAGITSTGEEWLSATSPHPWGPAMKQDYPEVLDFVRFLPVRNNTDELWEVRYREKQFAEDRILYADASVFRIFTWPLIYGNLETALAAPNAMVLSTAMADKYFGAENPMGKTLSLIKKQRDRNGNLIPVATPFTVTGVMKNIPAHSHFVSDFFISIPAFKMSPNKERFARRALIAHTYLLLSDKKAAATLEAKFPQMVEEYVGADIRSRGYYYRPFLQPLGKIHLSGNFDGQLAPAGNLNRVYLFSAIALFILVMACINFINLSTAHSVTRAKEVGVRKMIGAQRGQLVKQFLGEAMLFSFLALVVAASLAEFVLPKFYGYLGRASVPNGLLPASYFMILLVIGLFAGVSAGAYPAFFLSGFHPISVLKGPFKSTAKGAILRNSLVVFQFAISVILIVATLTVFGQLQFMRSRELGFDKEQVLIIPTSPASALLPHYEAFKQNLSQNPAIVEVTAASAIPAGASGGDYYVKQGATADEAIWLAEYWVEKNFIGMLGLKLIAGRNFNPEIALDRGIFDERRRLQEIGVLVNQETVRQMGWVSAEEALGKRFVRDPHDKDFICTVIGVIKDFHFESLRESIKPLVIGLSEPKELRRMAVYAYVAAKIHPRETRAAITAIRKAYDQLVADVLFAYSFLDEDFNALYGSEEKLSEVFGYISVLAIGVACLGLFGLVAFSAKQRTKELGVRKVLGASVAGIVELLAKDFVKLVVVANLIAWPVAWYAMNRWLQNFAYRIEIGWWMFALAGGLALLIALLTVSTQAIKAALANPVEALRYE
jgi:putative ABC transport system permease protein